VVARIPANKQSAALVTEWVVAMGILTVVMLPLAFSFIQESKLCRAYYYKAVAMQIVDGEMEVLAAGEWRAFKPGPQEYPISATSATNLPPGIFRLTVAKENLRLEWVPKARGRGGNVFREVKLK
jgi:hypothetical protein